MTENPPYKLSASIRDGIAEIVIEGELTRELIDRLRQDILAILRGEKVAGVLCDVRAAKGPHDITEAYFRTRSLPSDIARLPLAVVDLSDRNFHSFYETTAFNTGQSIKFFADVEAARAWLKSRIQKSHQAL
jgi:hypothetical protein